MMHDAWCMMYDAWTMMHVHRCASFCRVAFFQASCIMHCASCIHSTIEDLFLRPAVKKAVILLLYLADIKVLKDALAHLGPYQTLMSARCTDPGG